MSGTTMRARKMLAQNLANLLGVSEVVAMALVENIIDIARDEAFDIVDAHERSYHDRDDDY